MKEYSTTGGQALPDTEAGEEFTRLAPRLLVPSLTNRKGFNQAELTTMAETIKAWGVRHPLIVRPLPGARLEDTRLNTPKGQPLPTHEIVCGERRWLAANLAGAAVVPVIVRHLNNEQALEEQVTENVQREAYTALEEGEAFHRLMTHNNLTADQVAAKVGKSRRHVFNRTKLLDLRPETRDSLLAGDIDPTRALLLARIPDHAQQILALRQVAEKDYQGDFQMSLRDAEKYVQREFMLNLSSAPFKITDVGLVQDAGSCSDCSKRTGHNPDLFADIKSADLCTDAPCYRRKEEAHQARLLQQAVDNGQTIITGREAKSLMPNEWGGVDGYLRLDDVKDSPNGKPLRNLIARQLDMGEVKPTLIANPHQDGELIAVLPTATVAELLKAQGHEDAAGKVDSDIQNDAAAQEQREQEALKKEFEQGWRVELMKRTYAEVVARNSGGGTGLSLSVQRHIACHFAYLCNTDAAKQLCKMLDLGSVAPKQALLDHIAAHEQPEHVILLLMMYRDSHYLHWLPDPATANEGLMLVASDLGVDAETVKADVKRGMTAKITPLTAPADPSFPGLRIKGGAGEARKPGRAPASPRKPKLSADEASQGIAVAMQQMGSGQPNACGIVPPAPPSADSAPAALAAYKESAQGTLPVGFGIGQRVKVLGNVNIRLSKWIGKQGMVTGKTGPESWDVTFRGRNGGLAGFHISELEEVIA